MIFESVDNINKETIQEQDNMAGFIELTDSQGEKMLINANHILKVCSGDNECCIYLNSGQELSVVYVRESYSLIKRILQQ